MSTFTAERVSCLTDIAVRVEPLQHQPYEILNTAVLSREMVAQNRAFYDTVAADYAKQRAWTTTTEESIIKNLFRKVEPYLRDDSSILVVGTGTGKDQSVMQQAGYQCYGIDPSLSMIQEAHQRINNHLAVGHASMIPFPDNSFDFLYCDAAAEHMDQGYLYCALKEYNRVVLGGGKVLLGVRKGNGNVVKVIDQVGPYILPKYFTTYTEPQIADLVKHSGFRTVEMWSAEGGTPNVERSFPWINCIIEPMK